MKVSGDSREVARAAILLSMTASREEEAALKEKLLAQEIHGVAADYGGEFVQSVMKIVERAVVAAKRGLSVGGKIGVARQGEHVAVAVFFGIGLVHLNEVCIGMGHRAI